MGFVPLLVFAARNRIDQLRTLGGIVREGRRGRVAGAVLKRATKPIPVIGTVVVLATAYGVLRRKGFLRGTVDIALDALPIIGTAKGLVEVVRGDVIPDRQVRKNVAIEPGDERVA